MMEESTLAACHHPLACGAIDSIAQNLLAQNNNWPSWKKKTYYHLSAGDLIFLIKRDGTNARNLKVGPSVVHFCSYHPTCDLLHPTPLNPILVAFSSWSSIQS
jgi:hypothetical protein